MQAVIGTAGHVDHGKSALIQALTGTHPSHLPQEFSRGMTIDLGFACLTSPEGDEIGMIDVPGHERFLRNMVSSLWGLDLVLFVVAADEGWAPLTQEHLRVVSALGIDRVLVAVTKCDLVDDEHISLVEEQILEQFLAQCGLLPDIWRVSSVTGQGIAALHQALIDQVRYFANRQALIAEPHLYIDRVFSVNGIGTTVTGTLRGSGVTVGDTLRLYPSGQMVKIKSLQSYHISREQVYPCSRVAMSFRHLKKDAVARGDCLSTVEAPLAVSKEWIVQLNPGFSELKKQCELEVALGTSHAHGRCYLLGDGTLARLLLQRALPVFHGQPLLLMAPGGHKLTGAGRVVWTEPLARDRRPKLIKALLSAAAEGNESTFSDLQLAVRGYTCAIPLQPTPQGSRQLDEWWLNEEYYQRSLCELNQLLQDADCALTPDALARSISAPVSLAQALVDEQVSQQNWQSSAEGVSLFGASFGALSQEQQALLNEIAATGRQCFSAAQNERPLLQQQLKALVGKKYIIPMDDKLFITQQDYQALIIDLLDGRASGQLFSIADARESTGLARKQLIPLLNRMERDGWVRRNGDMRKVQKTVQQPELIN